jgi:hypothetical protein
MKTEWVIRIMAAFMIGTICPAATTVPLFDNFALGDRYNLTTGQTFTCDLFEKYSTFPGTFTTD